MLSLSGPEIRRAAQAARASHGETRTVMGLGSRPRRPGLRAAGGGEGGPGLRAGVGEALRYPIRR